MSRLVLNNARLFDGERPVIAGATVVVDGNRVVAAGGEAVESAPGDRVVDLGGRTVMPGMVTCHFHATYHDVGAAPTPFGNERHPAYQAILAVQHLQSALDRGYTGAVSAGGAHDIDPALAEALADGAIVGPRFIPGSRDISSTGFGNDSSPWYWGVTASPGARVCDGADAVRAAVRDEIKRGARTIKLFVTPGHGVGIPIDALDMTAAEVEAAVEAAHDRGVLIRAHVVTRRGLDIVIGAGVDLVDHGDHLDDELIARMANAGTFLAPSLLTTRRILDLYGGPAMGFDDLDRSFGILRDADAAGVKIVAGDDYGSVVLTHGDYSQELSLYANEGGIPPVAVLRWATKNGAELLGLGSEVGTLRPGKLADLLVVDGDPLDDITVLEDEARLVAIMRDGVLVKDGLAPLETRTTEESLPVLA